ncbi:MAG: outer membrane protein OmpA-like peptidoglycan-associated protein [Verrucomicrobiales bacterium]|jgi:outer membrane protein OmpA-like peptidoglycan-associated protein
MSKKGTAKGDDYYPLRWRLADFVEDIFMLHRAAAIGILALVGLGFIVLGFLAFGWGSNGSTQTATTASTTASTTATTAAPTTTTAPATSSAPTTTAPPTTAAPTTTTEEPVSSRAPTSLEQLSATEAGPVIEIGPTVARLIGGLPTDALADDTVGVAAAIFPGLEIEDSLVVDESFSPATNMIIRLSAPDLFGYNRAELNSAYFPLIDQLAAAANTEEGWKIEVSGHTDDSGPADSNQRLSEHRAAAAAQRLVDQGVSSDRITSVGRGEDQPVAPNSTDAGQLANRRVEFALTE